MKVLDMFVQFCTYQFTSISSWYLSDLSVFSLISSTAFIIIFFGGKGCCIRLEAPPCQLRYVIVQFKYSSQPGLEHGLVPKTVDTRFNGNMTMTINP